MSKENPFLDDDREFGIDRDPDQAFEDFTRGQERIDAKKRRSRPQTLEDLIASEETQINPPLDSSDYILDNKFYSNKDITPLVSYGAGMIPYLLTKNYLNNDLDPGTTGGVDIIPFGIGAVFSSMLPEYFKGMMQRYKNQNDGK